MGGGGGGLNLSTPLRVISQPKKSNVRVLYGGGGGGGGLNLSTTLRVISQPKLGIFRGVYGYALGETKTCE